MEDDWNFFIKKKYITECLEVLGQSKNIGQCLINKNYAENGKVLIKGGEFKTTKTGLRYYIHEYASNKHAEEKWIAKHGYGSHCNYWPHYSLRASLLKTKIFENIGEYNEKVSHFEKDYSHRYIKRGYVSAFLEGINSVHTGRLTNEIHDKEKLNAYVLNNEKQFVGKEISIENFDIKFETYVVNMDKRKDRWEEFVKNANDLKFLNYKRFSAVDGSKLKKTPKLQVIFDGNDYNMRVGLVGCALSHIKLCTDLINSDQDAYLILEDDLEFTPNFDFKLLHLYNNFKNYDWDLVYLGHHLINKDEQAYNKEIMPIAERWDANKSLVLSYGGTGGYFISRKGAIKLLEFINALGMTNGIDTVQQKSANILNVYYAYPHLYYSSMWRRESNIDTDIQKNFSSLTMPIEERLQEELKYYESIGEVVNKEDVNDCLTVLENKNLTNCYFEGTVEEINDIKSASTFPCYILGNKYIFIIPDINKCRFKDRLKTNGKFFIDDVLCYTD
jgi:GR25 family glycosyltransferase involved in LPS biosynthesis